MIESNGPNCRPFLATLAVTRIGTTDELPGRYCAQRDVWVIDEQSGPTPIVGSYLAKSVAPLTKVKREQDEFYDSGTLELLTKTAKQLERDDQSPRDPTLLPALVTKTNEVRERNDVLPQFLLELSTKTETRRERDD